MWAEKSLLAYNNISIRKTMTQREITDMISQRVHQNEPTAKVMLFGSRARGDSRPDSDWDVIILLDDNTQT